MAKKVKFGLSKCYYATKTTTGYGTPVALPGAVSFSATASGDKSEFYADNLSYWSENVNNGYEISLELAYISDAARQALLGETVDSNGVLCEDTGVEAPVFALGLQVEADDGTASKFWYYNCTAERPANDAETIGESKEPKTETLTITCRPDSDGHVRYKTSDTVSTSTDSAWFTAVYATPAG